MSTGGYLAAVFALVCGVLLATGHPRVLRRHHPTTMLAYSLLLFVASVVGGPFFYLYLLGALSIIWTSATIGAVGGVALVASYLAAAVVRTGDPESLLSPTVGLEVALLAIFCFVAGFAGSRIRRGEEEGRRLSSELEAEREQRENVENAVSSFAPVLSYLDTQGVLGWAVRAASDSVGAAYAHVTTPEGPHRTLADEGRSSYPTWWHPTVQKLVLGSSRTGNVERSDDVVEGIEGFVAVPFASEDGRSRGALVVGGTDSGPTTEAVLRLIADQIVPVLDSLKEAPAGRDPASGLPNRASLHRVLEKELAHDKAITVLAAELEESSNKRMCLREAGDRLKLTGKACFCDGDRFFVVVRGDNRTKIHRLALDIRNIVEMPSRGLLDPPKASIGAAVAQEDARDPLPVVEAALRSLEKARELAEKVFIAPSADDPQAPGLTSERPDPRFEGIVSALIAAADLHESNLGDHLRAVSHIAELLGRRMDLSPGEMDALVTGALLHDVGKLGVPIRILNKPGPLSEGEFEILRLHPVLGANILEPIEELSPVLPVVRHHHERYDGTGYPDGLNATEIPLGARIVLVADAFDSLTRDRTYRRGVSVEEAITEILCHSGTQFDPQVTKILAEIQRSDFQRKLAN